VGEVDGVTIIDDYGHHPVEIAAVLKAAQAGVEGAGHRDPPAAPLHALSSLFEDFCTCFNEADVVGIAESTPRASSRSRGRRATTSCPG
jgi:UDP-N-acetylmuramate--alanine ligase